MKKFTRYFSLIMGLIFVLFATVQYNDPDPELWISIYAVAALLSFGVFFGKYNKVIFLICGLLYLVGAILFIPSEWHGLMIQEEFIKDIELARESLGLLFTSLTMFYFAWVTRKN